MFQQIGLTFIALFIAYLCFLGVFGFLKDNYGIEISLGENLFISEDKGENWVALDTGKQTDVSGVNFAFDSQNPENLYMASAEGIFESSKGKNFSASAITQFKEEEKPALISNFIPDPKEPNTFYLISEEVGQNKLLVSHDKGKTFRLIFIAEGNDRIKTFAVDPFASNKIYLGTEEGGFLRSEDYGNSWKKVIKFSQPVGEIVPNPHREGEIYILLSRVAKDPFNFYNNGIPAKVKISNDCGLTFQAIENKINISKVKRELRNLPEIKDIVIDPSQNRIYFVSDYYLLRSVHDQMELVNLVSFSKENKITTFTVDPKNSNILYLGIGNLMYISENGGENWQIVEPPAKGEIEEIKINPADPETILISVKKTF
ncbi:MAG TPA: hypothetical protein PLL80_02310 [Candidatus Pacearchaeota archaeon]|nr:hypothetical protein [Candidatus Pacearchaeota archaeon]HOK94199.1 hypothetical protein [Candidatus Pacearchaeota archaeon]HPO75417.1 hypothetical protein [Candidatus Pacearchaeota archaeon]